MICKLKNSMANPLTLLRSTRTRKRVALILILVVLYILGFGWLNVRFGLVSAILVVIPVAFTGWYFGASIGLAAGFAGVILNSVLFYIFQDRGFLALISGNWSENFLVLVVGYSIGLMKKDFFERKRMRIELDSRERFISILGLAARDILNPGPSQDKYSSLANHLVNLFAADYACIAQWSSQQGSLTLLAATRPMPKPLPRIILEPDSAAPDAIVLKKDQALIMGDQPGLPRLINLAKLTEFSLPVHAAIAIPLIAGEYKFGLAVLGFDRQQRFSGGEIIYAQLTGSQVALALWTEEQDALLKRRLLEANTLTRIERALSETERVGPETVLQLIIDSAKELIPGAQQVMLHLVNSEKQLLIPRAVASTGKHPRENLNIRKVLRMGQGVAGLVIATGSSISISDAETDTRFAPQSLPAQYRSLIVAPIKSQDMVVGTLSIESDVANAFTADDNRLLDALGVQAAIAIENANLLETTREDLQEINALYQISKGLAVTLDPDQLIKDITNLLRENFGFYHVQVFVIDPSNGDLAVRHASGENAAVLMQHGHRLAVGSGIIGHVADLGQPFVTNNVEDVIFFIRNPLMPETQSELAVPIKINGKVLGVLDIQEKPPHQFTQRQMQLMTAVADQFAVALQKANLYDELQSALRQEKATRAQLIQSERLAVVGRLLASVAHELNNPLQAIQNALFLIKTDEKLSEQGQQDLDVVLSGTERMASLISRLRVTYRATQADDFKEVDLNEVIQDVYALTSTYMRHRQINFHFQPGLEVPKVPAIPDQIRQVALNLFMNAIDATQPGGKFTVSTRHLSDVEKVLMTFSDTGVGIKAEILPHIFEPFVTDKDTGTGLGLTITYDIIHQHAGEIKAENNPDQGATFKVWLPTKRES